MYESHILRSALYHAGGGGGHAHEQNDDFVTTLRPGDLTGLGHPPLVMEDTIGALLESKEGFGKRKAAVLRECLLAAGKYTLAGLPLRYTLDGNPKRLVVTRRR